MKFPKICFDLKKKKFYFLSDRRILEKWTNKLQGNKLNKRNLCAEQEFKLFRSEFSHLHLLRTTLQLSTKIFSPRFRFRMRSNLYLAPLLEGDELSCDGYASGHNLRLWRCFFFILNISGTSRGQIH